VAEAKDERPGRRSLDHPVEIGKGIAIEKTRHLRQEGAFDQADLEQRDEYVLAEVAIEINLAHEARPIQERTARDAELIGGPGAADRVVEQEGLPQARRAVGEDQRIEAETGDHRAELDDRATEVDVLADRRRRQRRRYLGSGIRINNPIRREIGKVGDGCGKIRERRARNRRRLHQLADGGDENGRSLCSAPRGQNEGRGENGN